MQEHPRRRVLIEELHARPFADITPPCDLVFSAFKFPVDAAGRDKDAERRQLSERLLERGKEAIESGKNHHLQDVGDGDILKWEQHSEFTSLMLLRSDVAQQAFDFEPQHVRLWSWAEGMEAPALVQVAMRIEPLPDDPAEVSQKFAQWFNPRSLSAARILDGSAVLAGDFRVDDHGQMRFALLVSETCDPSRLGQAAQSVLEIETYRAMAMLGLDRALSLASLLNDFDTRLEAIILQMAKADADAEGLLHDLLDISATLEEQAALMTFRFGATEAYNAIVHDRIALLGEARFEGLQTFNEFILRRFDPAIRRVSSTQARLNSQLNRTTRTAELLRTRVEVSRSAQNQSLLTSMDRRTSLQLRLQRTVEGLSVIAISYYAVNLFAGLLYPVAKAADISKELLTAGLVLPVLGVVALLIRFRTGGSHRTETSDGPDR